MSVDGISAAPALSSRATAVATAAVLTLQLMLTVDAQVMTVSLPAIQHELGFSPSALSWIPNAYAIAFGGLILLGGRIGDTFGRVRIFLFGTGLFVVASLAGGLSSTPEILIGARVAQGVASAIAAPAVLALVSTMAKDENARRKALASFTVVSAVGASAGLVLGGVLTDLLSWRWGLLINVPIGIAVILVVRRLVRDGAPHATGKFDVPGAALATLGSVALVWGFVNAGDNGWTSAGTPSFFGAAIVFITVLVLVERRAANPLIAIHLLKQPARVGALANMGLTLGAQASMLFFIAQYLQRVLDFSPLLAGVGFLPLTATIFIVTRWVPGWAGRLGSRPLLLVGGALLVASFLGWSALDTLSTYWHVVIPLIIHALGCALIFTAGTLLAMDGVPDSDAGSASGMLQMIQQIGGALGIAIVVSVYATGSVTGQFVPGLQAAFFTGGGLAALAAIIASATVASRRRSLRPEATEDTHAPMPTDPSQLTRRTS
jgi:EmrB/QacA subfamily drug resistance transporter